MSDVTKLSGRDIKQMYYKQAMEEVKIQHSELVSFFRNQTQDIQVQQDFIDRFLFQYDRKDTFYSSIKAYEEWFKSYYNRYDNFIAGIRRELNEQEDYQLAPATEGDQRRGKRQEYLIRFEALQQLEMSQDKKTRVYYRQLQQIMNKYIDQQRVEEHKRIQTELKAKDEEIKRLKHPNPESVYYIRNSDTNELLYIGRDLSKRQRRYLEHLTGRSQVLSGKHSLIDTYLATMDIQKIVFEYKKLLPGEAEQFELDEITRLNPRFNISGVQNEFKCPCHPQRRPYKGYMAYHKHMEKMHQQISEDSKVELESDSESENESDSGSEYEPDSETQ